MADVLPIPETGSVAENSGAERDALLEKLDELLEKYLGLLDEYQKARDVLSSQLSSGFISLAQANFNTSNMRYGQDHYDERMKAFRRAFAAEDETVSFKISCIDPSEQDKPSSQEHPAQAASEASAPVEEPSDESASKKPEIKDPIQWFGILVPQTLRKAQKDFISAVEVPIPQLCTILKQMRTLESEISKTRKQLRKLS